MNCNKCGKKMIESKELGTSNPPRCSNPACGKSCPKCGSKEVGSIRLTEAECGKCGDWYTC